MSTHKKNLTKFLALIVLILVISGGCIAQSVLPDQETQLIQLSNTSIITKSLIPTQLTETPNYTFTLTVTSTPKEIPTISSVFLWVERLLENNGGCRFPCWGGVFIIGETPKESAVSWSQAKFDLVSHEPGAIEKYTYEYIENDKRVRFSFLTKDEKMFAIRTGYNWKLSTILLEYGKPDEIWVRTTGIVTLFDEGDYSIGLFYRKQGFLVFLVGETNLGPYLRICGDELNEDLLEVDIVNPEYSKSHTFLEVVDLLGEYFVLLGTTDMVRFEELAEVDEEWFFLTYQDSESEICFDLMDMDYYFDSDILQMTETP
jgi:hypothetical protein